MATPEVERDQYHQEQARQRTDISRYPFDEERPEKEIAGDGDHGDIERHLQDALIPPQPLDPGRHGQGVRLAFVTMRSPTGDCGGFQKSDECGAEQTVERKYQHVGLETQKIGRCNEQRLQQVYDEYRLVVIESQRQQFVMDMILVRQERRTSLLQSLGHHHDRIENGQAEDHQRQCRAQRCSGLLREHDNEHAGRKAQELAAAISHEYPGRIRIEAQESHNAAYHGRACE